MNGETARQLWNDACDDEISAARRSELDGHLRSCTACAKCVRQMEAIVGGLVELFERLDRGEGGTYAARSDDDGD